MLRDVAECVCGGGRRVVEYPQSVLHLRRYKTAVQQGTQKHLGKLQLKLSEPFSVLITAFAVPASRRNNNKYIHKSCKRRGYPARALDGIKSDEQTKSLAPALETAVKNKPPLSAAVLPVPPCCEQETRSTASPCAPRAWRGAEQLSVVMTKIPCSSAWSSLCSYRSTCNAACPPSRHTRRGVFLCRGCSLLACTGPAAAVAVPLQSQGRRGARWS